MATPFPPVSPNDVWGQALVDAVESRDEDVRGQAEQYVNDRVGAGTLVLGPQDPIPPGTPAGTVIYRTV